MAAGGVINPVTGRWAVKSWRIDDLLPIAKQTYRTIEDTLHLSFFHSLPLRRYCLNQEDVQRIHRRMRNPRYENVLGRFWDPNEGNSPLNDTCGSFSILQAAYLDMPLLLESLRLHLNYIDEPFDHEQLTPANDCWEYKGIHAKRIFFCEGVAIKKNPWFQQLPVRPIKGETVLLKDKEAILPKGIFHRQKWLLAYGDGRCRIGATYDENETNPQPTNEGAKSLLKALKASIDSPFEILQHKAGLRPSTPDARPLVGESDKAKNLFILNGLGSKGASTAPLMCQLLLRYALQGEPLDPAIDCKRFTTS